MGFATSIHIRGVVQEDVQQCLRALSEHDCYVGPSGNEWIGVYSRRCEESAGGNTEKFAAKLSSHLGKHVLALCVYDSEFQYRLFSDGTLQDRYPTGGIRRLRSRKWHILALCNSDQAKRRVEAILNRARQLRPAEAAGLPEEEYVRRAYQDMARMQHMGPEERKKLVEQYRSVAQANVWQDAQGLCEGVGIIEFGWNYSDLAEQDREGKLPSMFGHL
ncbi:MAG TPA: hypothetical protein VL171_04500 [Verrucomicrobiae bacterium]|nr:hypothetical protein [Verrucomicrobiae bacterium]